MNTKELIASVKFPETNNYYEQTSADGYAQLGIARQLVGLDTLSCFREIDYKVCGLNAEYKIMGTVLPGDTFYVYTSYFVYEFMRQLGFQDKCKDIVNKVIKVGRYPGGMMRYCSIETNYMVPNVTPLAAHMLAWEGEYGKCQGLIEALREREKAGNWDYEDIRTGKAMRQEDSMHLCMMVYVLRELQVVLRDYVGIAGVIESLSNSVLDTIRQMNHDELQSGGIGWGIPWLMLATYGKDEQLFTRARDEVVENSIRNPNFRVRAVAALALARTSWL